MASIKDGSLTQKYFMSTFIHLIYFISVHEVMDSGFCMHIICTLLNYRQEKKKNGYNCLYYSDIHARAHWWSKILP